MSYHDQLNALIPCESFDNPTQIIDAAESARLPLVCGIAAIGALITDAQASTTGVAAEAMEDVGYLLTALGALVEYLSKIKETAMDEHSMCMVSGLKAKVRS